VQARRIHCRWLSRPKQTLPLFLGMSTPPLLLSYNHCWLDGLTGKQGASTPGVKDEAPSPAVAMHMLAL